MHLRQNFSVLRLAAVASALAASAWFAPGVGAQEDPPEPLRVIQVPAAESGPDEAQRQERLDALRSELQEVYEQLFELQVRYQSSGENAAVLDSLSAERERLRERVDLLSDRIGEENRLHRVAPPPAPRHGEADVYMLFEQLANPEHGIDTEQLGRILENRDGLGEVLAILGEQLKNLEVDVSDNRVRIDTGTGGKVSFAVPEELRKELSEGMREIGRELNRTLADSTGGATNWAQLIDQIPERFTQGWPDRRGKRRKVIAQSAFSMGNDFEVADDEMVQGDVLLIGADAYIAGEVQGNVYVLFGDVIVEEEGLIAGDAISVGGRVVMDDRAEILGRRLDFGDLGALAGGEHTSAGLSWALYGGRLLVLLALLLLVYALFGERMTHMVEDGSGHPGRNLISGMLWFTAIFGLFVVAAIGLAVSVIGIPVVLVLAAAMLLVSTMAYLVGCELVGRRLANLLRPDANSATGWTAALLGVGLFELPAIAVLVFGSAGIDQILMRPLTALELGVRFLALSIGFGAVVRTRIGRRSVEEGSGEPANDVVSASA